MAVVGPGSASVDKARLAVGSPPLRLLGVAPLAGTVVRPLATLRGQPLRLLGTTPPPGRQHRPGAGRQADAATGLWVACGPGEAIRLDMVALDEGYFTGTQLVTLGIGAGEVLGQWPLAAELLPINDLAF